MLIDIHKEAMKLARDSSRSQKARSPVSIRVSATSNTPKAACENVLLPSGCTSVVARPPAAVASPSSSLLAQGADQASCQWPLTQKASTERGGVLQMATR